MNRKHSSGKGLSRKFQIELTSWAVFLWISCFSLLLAWVFVLGILVGRGFIPESGTIISGIKNQFNKLQDMVSHRKDPNVASVKKEDYDAKLGFYNELVTKKERDKSREVPQEKAEPQKKEPGQVGNTTTEERIAEIRAQVSGKEAVGQRKKEDLTGLDPRERQRAPQQDSPAKGEYTVQLASMEAKSAAEEIVRKLIDRGYDAYCYEVQIRGKPRYRVRCGRFSTKDAAEQFAGKVSREIGLKGLVTRIE